MIIDYHCNECGLFVALGSLEAKERQDRFESSTLMMCLCCGTGHKVCHAAPPALEEPTGIERWEVWLREVGPNHTAMMQAVRLARDCGVNKARAFLDYLPQILLAVPTRGDAEEWVGTLRNLGAVADFRGHGVTFSTAAVVTDALLSQMGPCIKNHDELTSRLYPELWDSCEVLGELVGPTSRFDILKQRCGYCGRIGTLTSVMPPDPQPCPRCGGGRLRPLALPSQELLNASG
jgi:ribosomal protein L7/L12